MPDQQRVYQKILKDYWVKKIAGMAGSPVSLRLPLAGSAARPGLVRSAIAPATAGKIAEVARGNPVAEFVVYLSLYCLLLRRYCQYPSHLIYSNASPTGADDADLLFIKVDFTKKGISLREFLGQNFREVQECQQHACGNLEDVIRGVRERGTDTRMLFAFGFAYTTAGEATGPSALALRLNVRTAGEKKEFEIVFDEQVLDRAAVEQLAAQYGQLLQDLPGNLDQPLGDIPVLTAAEIHRLTVDFNVPRAHYHAGATLHEAFEEQARRTPSAVAVVCGDRVLTYKCLNETSDQVALAIWKKVQVHPDDVIALLLERSEWTIVVLLGILKAGAAYLPLESDQPRERIAYMLADAAVGLVIAGREADCHAYGLPAGRTICLENELPALLAGAQAEAAPTAGPGNIAYVIYTSGSTGVPKGTAVEHRSVMNLLEGLKHELQVEKTWRYVFSSALTFDASVKQLFLPLLTGAELHVVKEYKEVLSLVGYLEEKRINVLHAAPALWREILRCLPHPGCLPSLQCISSGGEKLTQQLAGDLRNAFPSGRLYNTYGPTETCVNATCYPVTGQPDGPVPIGKPLPYYRVYILGDDLAPQPAGVPGEICISGIGVARGYLNQQALTEKKFPPSPFEESQRMYRTGDLGYWLPNGDIGYIGRKDDQLKINGHRVEPNEVQVVLLGHAAVSDAVVVAQEDAQRGDCLTAYFTASNAVTNQELRSFMAHYLPRYMVPSFFVQMTQFPVTRHGKVDLQALPAQAAATLAAAMHYLPPRNDLEREMAAVWEAVLGAERVSIGADLFELGGNSLKALQIISALYQQTGLQVGLRDLVNHPTIALLSEFIAGAGRNGKTGSLIRLNKPPGGKSNVFFIPPMLGSSTIYRDLVRLLGEPFNCYGLQYRGFDYEEAFDESIESIAERFCGEISNLQLAGSVTVVGYSMGASVAFETVRLLEAAGVKTKLAVLDRRPGTGRELDKKPVHVSKAMLDEMMAHELGAARETMSGSVLDRMQHLLLHNKTLLLDYRQRGMISGDLMALEARDNAERIHMEEWRHFTTGAFTHALINGTHLEILDRPHLPELAEKISRFAAGG